MLILASASPRRRELLTQAGFDYTVQAAEIDETPHPGEQAAAYVERMAINKARAVLTLKAWPDTEADHLVILAADTAVVLPDGVILGKPSGPADAARMLNLLSGRTHAVMTGVAVVYPSTILSEVVITQVTMNLLDPTEIDAYIASGEPLDKAGAYAIQGYAARWIPRIEGDYTNVVGLPISTTVQLLAEAAQAQSELDELHHSR